MTEAFKHEIEISCKNMMSLAQNVLNMKPNIKKVVVLEHPKRYDSKIKDPMSLKAELAEYANSIYRHLWF